MTKKTMGYAMASYYGGRAEVRVRHIAVPVAVVDFTSMYPTIFIRQKLQNLIGRARINQRIVTDDARRLLESITLDRLYDPDVWPTFNRIALVQPEGDILPVRMRMNADDPFTIAITPFTSAYWRWYTLADLIAAKLLGGTVPRIVKAIEFVGNGINRDLRSIDFLGATFDPDRDIMATVIEERHRAIGSGLSDPDANRRGESPEGAGRKRRLRDLCRDQRCSPARQRFETKGFSLHGGPASRLVLGRGPRDGRGSRRASWAVL